MSSSRQAGKGPRRREPKLERRVDAVDADAERRAVTKGPRRGAKGARRTEGTPRDRAPNATRRAEIPVRDRDVKAARRAGVKLPPAAPTGTRRPVSHVGGKIEGLSGPPELARLIEQSLGVNPERGVRDHVHGFHSYPARLHPHTAARLIEALSSPRGLVVDPFCGSGTVLIEARRLGRRAIGIDLNPLAVRLSRFKLAPLPQAERQALLEAAERVTDHAEERRLAAQGPTRRYPPEQRQDFEVHVLLELDGLANGIKKEPPGPIRRALSLALSSVFSKVARDASPDAPGKRLASGFTIRFFEARVGELVRQLAEYEALLPEGAPPANVREADARELGAMGLSNVELFVTSPPYPGVLDYAEYHRTRLRWLALDATRFEHGEMGSRRRLQQLSYERAAAEWESDFVRVLSGMRAALSDRGNVALIVADSLLAGRPYLADRVVERCATRAGLHVAARGSQQRPHFHRESARAFGKHPRHEHLLILRRES